jgi:demethylmenaquinone methyltransferase/2-methoxy-6-polyprenyl-1,4-benzoquinol methylase
MGFYSDGGASPAADASRQTMNDHPDSALAGQPPPRGGSGEMFDAIAPRYDLLNRLLSLGIDQRWRRRVVELLALTPGARALDHATGTADLALTIARSGTDISVVGLDPSTAMLEVARTKVARAGLQDRVELRVGNAEDLSDFADASFDAVSMAFGIRNVPNRGRALAEMARVTRPGGRIAILELSEPRGGVMGPLARLHVHQIVPWLGGLLSGSREYRYLQQSIAAFPTPEVFAALMVESGIEVVSVEALTFGVCHLYLGTVRE